MGPKGGFPILPISDGIIFPEALSKFNGLRIRRFLFKKVLDSVFSWIEQLVSRGFV